MNIFTKPEVIILRESDNAKLYLQRLEELLPKAQDEIKNKIEKEIAITKAGIAGEENIFFELKNSNMNLVVLHDIYIETKDGQSAQIDFIVVTPKFIYLIECKNLYGNIEIDAKGNFIRSMEYGGKKYREGIYSPITQNNRHLAVLKECRAEEKNSFLGAIFRKSYENYYKSLIVLANPKTVVNDRYAKKEVKEQVIRADQLITFIKKMETESNNVESSKKNMLSLAESILANNIEERKDYTKKYDELLNEIKDTVKTEVTETKKLMPDEKLICPKCGAALVLRTAKKGENAGKNFYGCSAFPKCRFVRDIDLE